MSIKYKFKIIFQNSLFIFLIIMAILMFQNIKYLQGTARIINYTGIIRGATQRLVKLEMQENESDELLKTIDEIFYGLKHGSKKYELIHIKYPSYQESLTRWENNWVILKKEIELIREHSVEKSNILELSEENFHLADCTVTQIENYTQNLVDSMETIESLTIIDVLAILLILMYESMKRKKLSKFNIELSKKAYIDLHTGLMNKSKCEELFSNQAMILKDTVCFMFDLNNLKQTNDMFGHIEGDNLIINFATILKKISPKGSFIGRYGGDEFIVILYNSSEDQIEYFIKELNDSVKNFNHLSNKYMLSFAYGYAASWDYEGCILQDLFKQADYNMYLNKHSMKYRNVKI